MNNSERLFGDTLVGWSGVSVTDTKEKLSDMWIRGEKAGNHSSEPYDQEGIDNLRTQILGDFTSAPSIAAFKTGGTIQCIDDLDSDMQRRQQKPMPANAAVKKKN